MIPILLLACTLGDAPNVERFPSVVNDEAWRILPRYTPPLPTWAKTLVAAQPKATAGVLALDYLHRSKNPLGNERAAKVRWAVADEMKCQYAKTVAEFDLKRLGAGPADLDDLRAGDASPTDKIVIKFARKLTTAGSSVTDDEMATIVKRLGPERAVALVHTIAFANFHFRIIHALGVPVEADGPYPPIDFRFDPAQSALAEPTSRPPWKTVADLKPKLNYQAPHDWDEVDFEDILKSLATQQARKARIALPPKSRFEKLPPDVKKQTDTIVWMTISAGYQPEMTQAWFAAFRAFQQEGKLDRVFSSSLFWIVTRSNDCFY